MTSYVPQKGDFIAVTFGPQSGHEQRGRRPALVVSNTLFNKEKTKRDSAYLSASPRPSSKQRHQLSPE